MSSQVSLETFEATPEPEERDPEPSDYRPWSRPTNDSQVDAGRRCQGCKAHVSADFLRVFGDDGVAHACLECVPAAHIRNGAAANPDFTPRANLGGSR